MNSAGLPSAHTGSSTSPILSPVPFCLRPKSRPLLFNRKSPSPQKNSGMSSVVGLVCIEIGQVSIGVRESEIMIGVVAIRRNVIRVRLQIVC